MLFQDTEYLLLILHIITAGANPIQCYNGKGYIYQLSRTVREKPEPSRSTYRRRLFLGDIRDLGLELALGLRLAALRAGIRKDVRPEAFRRMKHWTLQEAGARSDVIVNAMGWGPELGLDWTAPPAVDS
jgi:hypothetical protein